MGRVYGLGCHVLINSEKLMLMPGSKSPGFFYIIENFVEIPHYIKSPPGRNYTIN